MSLCIMKQENKGKKYFFQLEDNSGSKGLNYCDWYVTFFPRSHVTGTCMQLSTLLHSRQPSIVQFCDHPPPSLSKTVYIMNLIKLSAPS